MQKDRKIRAMAITIIGIAVIGLSIGYATLSQVLNISGTANIKGQNWDVVFEDLKEPTANDGLVGSAKGVSASLTTTTLSFAAELSLPGDAITYRFKVANNGTIDAILSEVPVLSGLSEAQAQNVVYEFTYEDGTLIKANDELPAGETKNLKLVIKFDADATTVSEEDKQLSLSTTMNYVQK